ncbi:MFS transporter [Pseudonocardia acaciae]|uniref:MFS transporter n=1 Tax=Pseudonocardia acaciae TaxID=551276 RepID=UPI00048E8385|nr:MFS transporter [Pseudonocardia acaciae]
MDSGSETTAMDDAPLNRFHLRVAAFSAGGILCDGYMLGIIGPALSHYSEQVRLGPVWTGLLGSSALIGLFVGSLLFGWLTDRVGRRAIYTLDLAVFVVGSLLHLVVTDVAWVFALRLVLGIAIGADYAISPSMLAEFAPRRYRGALLAAISAIWSIGFFASYLVGSLLSGSGPNAWQWMLASAAVPAFLVGLMRIGCPESPRWLVRHGRAEEALRVVREHIDPRATLSDLDERDLERPARFRTLFSREYRSRIAVGGVYWFSQVVPLFAILTFLPSVLSSLGVHDDAVGELGSNLFLLIGSTAGIFAIAYAGRRPFILSSTAALVLLAVVLGLWRGAPGTAALVLLALFILIIGCAQVVTSVYPSEIFPTEVRASGVGLCTSISRVGAAVGTFLLPLAIDAVGVHTTILITAVILAAGLAVAWRWAPETSRQTLGQASHGGDGHTVREAG